MILRNMINNLNVLKEKLLSKKESKFIFISALILFPIVIAFFPPNDVRTSTLIVFFLPPVIVMILINQKIINYKRYLIAITPVVNIVILLFFFILYLPINFLYAQFTLSFGILPVFALFFAFLSRIANERALERKQQEQLSQGEKVPTWKGMENQLIFYILGLLILFTVFSVYLYFFDYSSFEYFVLHLFGGKIDNWMVRAYIWGIIIPGLLNMLYIKYIKKIKIILIPIISIISLFFSVVFGLQIGSAETEMIGLGGAILFSLVLPVHLFFILIYYFLYYKVDLKKYFSS